MNIANLQHNGDHNGSRIVFDRNDSDSWLLVQRDGKAVQIDSSDIDGMPRLTPSQVKKLVQFLEWAIS